MTIRVYLTSAKLSAGPPLSGDIVAERLFVHACEAPEIWVETESTAKLDRGKAVSFAFSRPMGLTIERISGTIERTVSKRVTPRTRSPDI